MDQSIEFRPLTPERWDDLERLFGPERGAVSGCWCMWFKLRRPEWDAAGRPGRKAMFRALVEAGPPPGVLGYAGEQALADAVGRAVADLWARQAPGESLRQASPRMTCRRVH